LARGILTNNGGPLATFFDLTAAAPGFADTATTDDGIDSDLIDDPSILSAIQAEWPTVASLYFTADGAPIG
jgi:hypothetical protein